MGLRRDMGVSVVSIGTPSSRYSTYTHCTDLSDATSEDGSNVRDRISTLSLFPWSTLKLCLVHKPLLTSDWHRYVFTSRPFQIKKSNFHSYGFSHSLSDFVHTFLIFRFGGMMIMSLCEELDSEDSGASLSAAATVSAKKKKKHAKNWIYLINKCIVCIARILCMINVHILKILRSNCQRFSHVFTSRDP